MATSQGNKKSCSNFNSRRSKRTIAEPSSTSASKPLLGKSSSKPSKSQSSAENGSASQFKESDASGGSEQGEQTGPAKSNSGLFRPLVVLANVNLFRRFSSQYRRLPQEPPPRDRLEQELERLNNKIDSLLDKLEEVKPEAAQSPDEECIVCSQNKATMQTFPCGHQVVCRMCFVKTIQSAVTEKKLPLRCVFCRAKILRLKQHHKMVNAPGVRPPHRSSSIQSNNSSGGALPQSASNYSFNRLTSSSSNHSFASGVSSVSSASSASSKSLRSFNFDTFSNFQSVNLINKSQLTRTTSGNSFSGWRRSRSPSPIGAAHRSRSVDVRLGSAGQPQAPRITVDRTPSDESLSSCAQLSMTSPGSSSSPRSPISPPWSTGSRSPGAPNQPPSAFFPTSPMSPASPAGSPASPSGYSGFSTGNEGDGPVPIQPVPIAPTVTSRLSRMCTPLSPIKESVRENGSNLELRCSPERSVTSPSPPMSIEQLEMENLMTSSSRIKRRQGLTSNLHHPLLNFNSNHNNNNNNVEQPPKQKPSSRIRCTDKILSQLEMQANINSNESQPAKPSIKQYLEPGRNESEYDNRNANRAFNNTNCAKEDVLDNSKSLKQKNRNSKSVTFKDC